MMLQCQAFGFTINLSSGAGTGIFFKADRPTLKHSYFDPVFDTTSSSTGPNRAEDLTPAFLTYHISDIHLLCHSGKSALTNQVH